MAAEGTEGIFKDGATLFLTDWNVYPIIFLSRSSGLIKGMPAPLKSDSFSGDNQVAETFFC